MEPAAERVAVAVVRAWVEPGEERLKIRIVADSHPIGHPSVGVASDVDGACAIVKAWLDAFLDGPGQIPAVLCRAATARIAPARDSEP